MVREKREPYKFKSGAVYDGEWLDNMRDGYGVHTWFLFLLNFI